jgi:hypothetical protein
LRLLARKLKHKILRKPPDVSFYLLVQPLGRHAVDPCEVGINQDTLTAQHDDMHRNFFRAEGGDLLGWHGSRSAGTLDANERTGL